MHAPQAVGVAQPQVAAAFAVFFDDSVAVDFVFAVGGIPAAFADHVSSVVISFEVFIDQAFEDEFVAFVLRHFQLVAGGETPVDVADRSGRLVASEFVKHPPFLLAAAGAAEAQVFFLAVQPDPENTGGVFFLVDVAVVCHGHLRRVVQDALVAGEAEVAFRDPDAEGKPLAAEFVFKIEIAAVFSFLEGRHRSRPSRDVVIYADSDVVEVRAAAGRVPEHEALHQRIRGSDRHAQILYISVDGHPDQNFMLHVDAPGPGLPAAFDFSPGIVSAGITDADGTVPVGVDVEHVLIETGVGQIKSAETGADAHRDVDVMLVVIFVADPDREKHSVPVAVGSVHVVVPVLLFDLAVAAHGIHSHLPVGVAEMVAFLGLKAAVFLLDEVLHRANGDASLVAVNVEDIHAGISGLALTADIHDVVHVQNDLFDAAVKILREAPVRQDPILPVGPETVPGDAVLRGDPKLLGVDHLQLDIIGRQLPFLLPEEGRSQKAVHLVDAPGGLFVGVEIIRRGAVGVGRLHHRVVAVHDGVGAGHDAVVHVAFDVRQTEAVARLVQPGAQGRGGLAEAYFSSFRVVHGRLGGISVTEGRNNVLQTVGPAIKTGRTEHAEKTSTQCRAANNFSVHHHVGVGDTDDLAFAAAPVRAEQINEVIIDQSAVELPVHRAALYKFRPGVLAGDDLDMHVVAFHGEVEGPVPVAQPVGAIGGIALVDKNGSVQFLLPEVGVRKLRILGFRKVGDVVRVGVLVHHDIDVSKILRIRRPISQLYSLALRTDSHQNRVLAFHQMRQNFIAS